MSDENPDLNTGQSVADTDLNKAQAVIEPDLIQPVTEGQAATLADGDDKSKKTVKYDEFTKANEAKKAAEAESQLLRNQMALLVANQQQVQQPTTQQPGSTYELAMQQLGLTADDLFGGNIVKVQSRKAELDTMLQQQQSVFTANQQFISNHPDFTQVVGSVNPATGQIIAWSQEALALQQKKAYLVPAFQSAQGAYQAVMEERRLVELESKDTANKEHLTRQGIDTKINPLGGSAAGGVAADAMNQQLLSTDQVLEIKRKLAAGESV